MVSSNEPLVGKCNVCAEESKLKCSNCNQVFYCSAEHQKADWKKHKPTCHPFRIESNEKFGRYLVASRYIKPGEIVLQEAALVSGPSQVTGPVCVGCMQGLTFEDHMECERCGWPVCQRECQDCPEHLPECELTQARGSKISIQHFVTPHPTYQSLCTLRCLLLKERNPKKWARLLQLESHELERRGSAQWKCDREGIAKFIPRFFKCNKWDEEEILKVTGILQINGHEVPLSEPPYVAVYDYASLVEHSCFPNLSKSFSKKGDIIFWAPKAIEKNTSLSICYSDALWGTASRQHHLMQTKMFKCECVRCKDVTELGTFYSALRCNKNECSGLVLPLSLETWDNDWKCLTCKQTIDRSYVSNVVDRAGKDLAAMEKGNPDFCQKYINHYSKWLPPNHQYITEVKVALAQLIGAGGPEELQMLSDEVLEHKISLCEEVLQILEIIAPAESRIIGTIHFELHAALAERGRRLSADDNVASKCALEKSLEHVEVAADLLKYEPSTLSEGQVYAQAKINRDSLKLVLRIPV